MEGGLHLFVLSLNKCKYISLLKRMLAERKERDNFVFIIHLHRLLYSIHSSSFGEDEGKTIDGTQGNSYTFGLPCVVLPHKSHVVLTKYHGQRCQHLSHRKLVAKAENELLQQKPRGKKNR